MNAPKLDDEDRAHHSRLQAAISKVDALEKKAASADCTPELRGELIAKMARRIVVAATGSRSPVLEAIAATNVRERLLARGVLLPPEPPTPPELEAECALMASPAFPREQ